MVCFPGGATLASYAVWKYSSANPGLGTPRVHASNAACASSMPVVIDTIELHGQSASGTLENRGRRDSPQFTFITGLVMRQPSIRDWNSPGTPPSATRPTVRRGSALE